MLDATDMIRRPVTAVLATVLVALIPLTAQAQTVPTDGLQLWLRADAVEAADDAKVTTWTDRGPQGRALSQMDVDRRPTYVADAINGQPLLKFDDNDGFNASSLLTAGSDYTIMRVTRQEDRGYVNVTEGTLGDDEAGSTLQRFLQGQVAEVLVYDRRLSKTEKTTVSEALGQRYNLGPGATVARSDNATDAEQEGVRVHGAWTITVRNPDGSLDTRRTSENSFENPQALSNFLARSRTVGYWRVEAESGTNSENPCEETSDGTPRKCRITEVSNPNFNWVFPGLDISAPDSGDNANSVVANGSFTSQRDGQVEFVSTSVGDCDPSTAPSNCNIPTSSVFTSKQFSSPVSVTSGQQVNVSVVISFQ